MLFDVILNKTPIEPRMNQFDWSIDTKLMTYIFCTESSSGTKILVFSQLQEFRLKLNLDVTTWNNRSIEYKKKPLSRNISSKVMHAKTLRYSSCEVV